MGRSGAKPGRRLKFEGETRCELANLIRQHGLTGARKVSPVPISLSTLLRIARELGVKLKKGRRKSTVTSSRTKRLHPLKFEGETRHQMAALIRQYGARGAREVSPVPISLATLLKIAREHGIKLMRGRKPKKTVRESTRDDIIKK
jgi:hypothetical protein